MGLYSAMRRWIRPELKDFHPLFILFSTAYDRSAGYFGGVNSSRTDYAWLRLRCETMIACSLGETGSGPAATPSNIDSKEIG
jgi:hypothetical protein